MQKVAFFIMSQGGVGWANLLICRKLSFYAPSVVS